MKINNLPPIEWTTLNNYYDKRAAYLITSKTSSIISKEFLNCLQIKHTEFISSTQKEDIQLLLQKKMNYPVFYAVGGGAVNDIARLLASHNNAECIAIPTIISTDTLFVDCTGLRNKGTVEYIPSKRFDKILLVEDILNKTPWNLHLSGLGDVLSIYTAIYDWKYANDIQGLKEDEVLSSFFYHSAQGIIEGIFSSKNILKVSSKESYLILLSSLYNEVTVCNCFGNSRPEEGSEHFFVYALENYWKERFLHGYALALGVIICSALQGQNYIKINDFLNHIGLDFRTMKIPVDVILKVFQNIQKYVVKHNMRYSFLNTYDYNEYEILSILKKINY